MSQNQLDVRYVAGLARLELSDEEIAEFQPQLNAIMEHVEALKELDIEGIEPTAHAAPVFDRMRNDEPHTSLPVESVMQNAPDQSQNQIRVPKVVGQTRIYNTKDSPIQDVMQESLPPQYNDRTQLTYEVPSGKSTKDFDLGTED